MSERGDPGPGEHSARRVVSGFVVLALASLASQAIGFVALAVASRRLGAGELGDYNFALSIAQYVALGADFGVTVLAIRDIAREPARARQITGEVLILQAVVAAVCFGALLALTPFIAPTDDARALLPIATATMLVTSAFTLHWALRALQEMRAVAFSELAGQIAFGALVPVLVIGGVEGAKRYAWLQLLGAAITAALTVWWMIRKAGAPLPTLDTRVLARRLWLSLPIGISFAMIKIYYSIDSVMLGYLRSIEEVGLYAVAYKLPLALIGFGTLWIAAFYPHASALSVRDPERLRRHVGTFSSVAIVVALALAVGATFGADGLMPLLFGRDFGGATTPFILLTWAAAVILVSVNFGNVLLACGDERRYAIGVSAGAFANLGINAWAIPTYGMNGAACATIAAELLVLAYMVRRFRAVLGPPTLELERIARGAAASAVLAGVLIALPGSVPVLLRLAIGAVVWLAAAVALGAVTRADLAQVRRERAAPAPVEEPVHP
jgi:O-antigen/teichoic acid export membrane protein